MILGKIEKTLNTAGIKFEFSTKKTFMKISYVHKLNVHLFKPKTKFYY
jgi:hypothetical protein